MGVAPGQTLFKKKKSNRIVFVQLSSEIIYVNVIINVELTHQGEPGVLEGSFDVCHNKGQMH